MAANQESSNLSITGSLSLTSVSQIPPMLTNLGIRIRQDLPRLTFKIASCCVCEDIPSKLVAWPPHARFAPSILNSIISLTTFAFLLRFLLISVAFHLTFMQIRRPVTGYDFRLVLPALRASPWLAINTGSLFSTVLIRKA